MPRFRVCIVESREYFYEIEADDKEDAEEKSKELETADSLADTFRESFFDWAEEITEPPLAETKGGVMAIDRSKTIRIDYTNYRGERAWRTVVPLGLRWGSSEYHDEPQWLLEVYETEKEARRDFALKDCHSFGDRP